MDDLERMERALAAADKAGDVAAALQITRDMKAMLQSVNPAVADPTDHAAEGAKALAKETGVGEAVLVGAGRKFSRIGSGTADIVTGGPSEEESKVRSGEDASYSFLRKTRPFATAGGEVLPYAAGTAGMSIPAAAATVAIGEAAEPGTTQDRLKRGAAGGVSTVAGGLLAKGVGSFLAPVTKKAASPANQEALKAAERIGVKPRLSEVTGSPLVARLEDTAARVPGGAGVIQDFAHANTAAVNRAAAKSIGEVADELTPSVFSQASDRMGKVFEEIKNLKGKPIQVGQNVAAAADDILKQQGKMLPQQQDAALVNLANQAKALVANKGRIDGETYQLVRSGLSEAAFDASGSNRVLYGKLLDALDESADTSLRAIGNTTLADALKTVRPEYANLKLLEKGSVAEAGNVSPAKVASAMRSKNPGAFRRGSFTGPLRDVATVGEGLKPLRAGSPTFEREAVSNPISALLNAAWSYPVAKATTSPLVTMYPRALGRAGISNEAMKYLEGPGRAAVAAALQESSLLPLLPAAQ